MVVELCPPRGVEVEDGVVIELRGVVVDLVSVVFGSAGLVSADLVSVDFDSVALVEPPFPLPPPWPERPDALKFTVSVRTADALPLCAVTTIVLAPETRFALKVSEPLL